MSRQTLPLSVRVGVQTLRFTPDDLEDLAGFVGPGTEALATVEGTGPLSIGGQPRTALVLGMDARNTRQMGATALVGLLFGIYPALKAANLSPVEAMRYE